MKNSKSETLISKQYLNPNSLMLQICLGFGILDIGICLGFSI